MFSIVYVLTSNEKDYYYQQLMISLISLRKVMPKQDVIVLVDEDTYNSFSNDRGDIFNYAKIKKCSIPSEYSQKEKSRYLKTSLRSRVTGNFIFVDSDTVICDNFSNYDNQSIIAMVYDRNCLLSDRQDKGINICNTANRLELPLNDTNQYFNSGVMWVRDDPIAYDFFNEWHLNWKKMLRFGMCVDQPSLNYVNVKWNNFIDVLGGEWNCQISLSPAGIQYISSAHIMHYFNTRMDSPYLLCNEKEIRNYKKSDVVNRVLQNPRGAFKLCYLMTNDSSDDLIMNSKQYKLLKIIFEKMNRLYRFNERVLSALSKIMKNKHKNWTKY